MTSADIGNPAYEVSQRPKEQTKTVIHKEWLQDRNGNEELFMLEYTYLITDSDVRLVTCIVTPWMRTAWSKFSMTDEELKESVKVLLTDSRPTDDVQWHLDCEIEIKPMMTP